MFEAKSKVRDAQLWHLPAWCSLLTAHCPLPIAPSTAHFPSQFDCVDRHDFLPARNNGNPWEKIGKNIFMNRAATKMANLDQVAALSLDNQ